MPTIPLTEVWCSRAEAAAYLGYADPESVDRKLTSNPKGEVGKMRFRRMANGAGRNTVRVWRADVLKLLAPFTD